MISLLIKDLLLIKRNTKAIQWLPLLAPIFVITQNLSLLMPIMSLVLSLLLGAFVTQSMQWDETCNWNKCVIAMPVSRLNEALSKYLLLFLFAGIASAALSLLGIGVSLYDIIPRNMILPYAGMGLAYVLLYGIITIPATYRFGTTYSRYILMCFIMIPVSIPIILNQIGISIDLSFMQNLNNLIFIALIIVGIVIATIISVLLSLSAMKKNKK